MAVSCGRDVEALDARTPNQTLVAQPDGTMRLDVSAVAVRALRDGAWVAPDPAVVRGDGGFEVAAAVTPMTFSDGRAGRPLATIERDGHSLSVGVPFALPVPQVAGPQLTYADVLPDVDLVVTVAPDATGFSEVLRVENPAAAADPRVQELLLTLQPSAGLTVAGVDGGFAATDTSGVPVFHSPVPLMWDSRETALSGSGTVPAALQGLPVLSAAVKAARRAAAPTGTETVRAMQTQVDKGSVRVRPDRVMLTSPDTVWPLYIDPDISGATVEWTSLREAYGQVYKFTPDAGVGLCNVTVVSTCGKTHKSRLLWKFSELHHVGNLAVQDVVSATFSAVGTHSYDCTARPTWLYRVDNWSSATVWPGSGYTLQDTRAVAHKSTCSGQPARRIEFSALEGARAVAQFGSSQLTLALGVEEESMNAWKRYGHDATLSITYNRAPVHPTDPTFSLPTAPCVTGTGLPYLRTTTPTITATHHDPDHDKVQANLDVYLSSSPSGTGILWHDRPAPQLSGATQNQKVPEGILENGKTYRLQLNSVDTSGRGGPAAVCEFAVDTQPPVQPSVTALANGSQPVYAHRTSTGGIGQTGSFVLGGGGSTDVASYRYSVDSTAHNLVANGASPTITVTPSHHGTSTLSVVSVDHAGYVSTARTHEIVAAWPQKVAWKLDETSGATAASTSTTVTSTGTTTTNPLPLSVSVPLGTRVGGWLAARSGSTTDRALNFDGSDDTATTTTAAVDTAKNFTVSAAVRPTAATGTATALSQDGVSTAAFQLGYRPCATGTGSCWSFSMSPTDSTSAVPRAVVSTIPVQAGEWTEITGVHDAGADTLQLWVCQPHPDDFGDIVWDPVLAGTAAHAGAWTSTQRLQLGRAKGTTPALWSGAVGEVTVTDGLPSQSDIHRTCNPVE